MKDLITVDFKPCNTLTDDDHYLSKINESYKRADETAILSFDNFYQ